VLGAVLSSFVDAAGNRIQPVRYDVCLWLNSAMHHVDDCRPTLHFAGHHDAAPRQRPILGRQLTNARYDANARKDPRSPSRCLTLPFSLMQAALGRLCSDLTCRHRCVCVIVVTVARCVHMQAHRFVAGDIGSWYG